MKSSIENIGVLLHRFIIMNRRVDKLASYIINILPKDIVNILDVGCGTGEIANAVMIKNSDLSVSGVDIKIRPKTLIAVTEYDGYILPFDDNAFDVVMLIDVLHHCDNPISILQECARVSKNWILIKDHVSNCWIDNVTLRFMDWIGNRSHGINLTYNYLSLSDWSLALTKASLNKISENMQLNIYPKPFNFVFGRDLHCLYLLRKEPISV